MPQEDFHCTSLCPVWTFFILGTHTVTVNHKIDMSSNDYICGMCYKVMFIGYSVGTMQDNLCYIETKYAAKRSLKIIA